MHDAWHLRQIKTHACTHDVTHNCIRMRRAVITIVSIITRWGQKWPQWRRKWRRATAPGPKRDRGVRCLRGRACGGDSMCGLWVYAPHLLRGRGQRQAALAQECYVDEEARALRPDLRHGGRAVDRHLTSVCMCVCMCACVRMCSVVCHAPQRAGKSPWWRPPASGVAA